MRFTFSFITLAVIFLFSSNIYAQSEKVNLSGYVRDKDNGEPLIGAVVSCEDDAVITNSYGYFNIKVKAGTQKISAGYIGYDTSERSLKVLRDTVLSFNLTLNNTITASVLSSKAESGFHSRFTGSIDVPVNLIKSGPAVIGEPDLMKTIQMMPGIQGGREGFAGIYIRGGDQDENLILLDGVNIYNVNHFFGFFSAFTPEAIKKVSVYTGAIPARYGSRTSGVIDIRTNDGNNSRIAGEVTLGLLNERLHIEGPLFSNKTTFSLSARGSHSFIFSPLIRLAKVNVNYWFYDVNFKLTHRFNENHKLSFSTFNGKDSQTVKRDKTIENSERIKLRNITSNDCDYGNTVASLKWNGSFSNGLFAESYVYINRYDLNIENRIRDLTDISGEHSESATKVIQKSGITDYGIFAKGEYRPSNSLSIESGIESVFHTFKPQTSFNFNNRLENTSPGHIQGAEFSVFAEGNFDITDKWQADLGVRGTGFSVRGKSYFAVQPRFGTVYRINDRLSAKFAYSRMSQYIHLLHSEQFNMPTDIWVPITEKIPPQTSNILAGGLYYTRNNWEASIEPYYKRLSNTIDYRDNHFMYTSFSRWEEYVSVGKGQSYGIDFWLKKTLGKTTGFVKYSISKSERWYPDGSINGGEKFPFTYDRRHYINIYLAHEFNDKWSCSASWSYMSGNYTTVPTRTSLNIVPQRDYEYNSEELKQPELRSYVIPHYAGKNNYRLPASHHLDLSANRKFKYRNRREGLLTFGIYNVYNAHNPNFYMVDFMPSEYKSNPTLDIASAMVILPSISYTYKF